eukprot:jgi/Bigna1/82423/fgenesh1_pg.92_\
MRPHGRIFFLPGLLLLWTLVVLVSEPKEGKRRPLHFSAPPPTAATARNSAAGSRRGYEVGVGGGGAICALFSTTTALAFAVAGQHPRVLAKGRASETMNDEHGSSKEGGGEEDHRKFEEDILYTDLMNQGLLEDGGGTHSIKGKPRESPLEAAKGPEAGENAKEEAVHNVSVSSPHGVRCHKAGHVGFIVLDRPEKLNAANLAMLSRIEDKLTQWYVDETVRVVILKSSSPRAFCAGGDVAAIAKSIAEDPKTSHPKKALMLEYQKVKVINSYLYSVGGTKLICYPSIFRLHLYIARNCVTMGFGAGLAAACSIRVATNTTLFAMPEAKIGFFPDVGYSTFESLFTACRIFLPCRAVQSGNRRMCLLLCNAPFHFVRLSRGVSAGAAIGVSGIAVGRNGSYGGSDLIALGIATHYVTEDKLPEVEKEILTVLNDQDIGTRIVLIVEEWFQAHLVLQDDERSIR